jgi:hypothetical protein
MARKPLISDSNSELTEAEIEARMNRAILRTLQTLPTPLKDRPKLRKKKSTSAAAKPSSKTE